MRHQLKNPEDWNPNARYVYARPLRLGEADNPLMEVGSPVDMEGLTKRLGMRRVRAFFLQGSIVPAPGTEAAMSTAEQLAAMRQELQELRAARAAAPAPAPAPVSRFASASTAEPIAEE